MMTSTHFLKLKMPPLFFVLTLESNLQENCNFLFISRVIFCPHTSAPAQNMLLSKITDI